MRDVFLLPLNQSLYSAKSHQKSFQFSEISVIDLLPLGRVIITYLIYLHQWLTSSKYSSVSCLPAGRVALEYHPEEYECLEI